MAETERVAARVSLVTLGVRDVAAATEFYRALGWEASAASVPGEVTFFRTAGAILALWDESSLAADARVVADRAGAFRGVALALNLGSQEAVDTAMSMAAAAGGRIVRAPGPTDWGGYSGYFADPDGNLWEVAHNPGFPLGEDGLPTLP